MKTPEEIKKGLECCQTTMYCEGCPYDVVSDFGDDCTNALNGDTLTYIQQLESTVSEKEKVIAELLEKIEQLKRERDAIVERLRGACTLCKNNKLENEDDLCFRCKWGYGLTSEDSWEFDGVCPENTEVD